MSPFFSIIIPTYNRASLISKAINSLLAQTYSNWELIVIDDGSKDNTQAVVAAFNDNRINYIYQKNSERSAARNNGIRNAKGTYICFLDSDDYYLQNRLELLYTYLKHHNFPVAFHYTGMVIDGNGTLSTRKEKKPGQNIYDHLAVSVIHSQQVCIHRSILEQFQYDINFHIGEDMELWLRIAEKYKIHYIDDQFTVAVVEHDTRSVNIKLYNSFPDRLRMLNAIFKENHPGKNISGKLKHELISDCYFGTAKYYIYQNNRLAAIKYLTLAIFSDIGNHQNKYRLNLILNLSLFMSSTKKIKQLLA
jgi:glycosyltransferase involved in cell wall biosynthesis